MTCSEPICLLVKDLLDNKVETVQAIVTPSVTACTTKIDYVSAESFTNQIAIAYLPTGIDFFSMSLLWLGVLLLVQLITLVRKH